MKTTKMTKGQLTAQMNEQGCLSARQLSHFLGVPVGTVRMFCQVTKWVGFGGNEVDYYSRYSYAFLIAIAGGSKSNSKLLAGHSRLAIAEARKKLKRMRAYEPRQRPRISGTIRITA